MHVCGDSSRGLRQGEIARRGCSCGEWGWTGGRGSQIATNETNPRADVTLKGLSLRAVGILSRLFNWGVTQPQEV